MQRLMLFFVLLLAGVSAAAPALAQDADAIGQALLNDGFFVESDYSQSGLSEAIDQAGADAPFLVALNDNISDPSALADSLLARIGFGSVVVLTPDSIGGASFDLDSSGVDARLDRVVEALGANDDLAAAVTAFADGPGGISGAAVLLGVGALGVGGIALASARSRRRIKDQAIARLEEARAELARQVDLVANDIVELSSAIEISEDVTAESLYRSASATYATVEEALGDAPDLVSLEKLSDQLDEARWELDAAEATLNGDEVPQRPTDRTMACFFDPTHRAGIEDVEIETAAGNQTVGVCRDCARGLRSSTPPQPASIPVDGRAVPAPQAPRHSGGGGFEWMDIFSVIVDGSKVPYSVGGGRGSRSPRRGSGLGGSGRATRSGGRSSTAKTSQRKTISRGRSRRR